MYPTAQIHVKIPDDLHTAMNNYLNRDLRVCSSSVAKTLGSAPNETHKDANLAVHLVGFCHRLLGVSQLLQ